MRDDRDIKVNRAISLAALVVALIALVVAGRAMWVQNEHTREMEALGDLIRRSADTGQPVMDIGPPGGGRPELDMGD